MQPRANRANRAAHHLRGFFVTALFEFAENYCFPKLRRQLQHRRPNAFDALALFRLNRRARGIFQDDSESVAVLMVFLERNLSWQAFEMLQHPVAGHAVEEATKRATSRVILPRISQQHQKDILHNLFGGPRISRHAQGEAVQRPLVAPIKQGEGLLVALSSAPEQYIVSFLVRDAHLSWVRRSARPDYVHSCGVVDKFPVVSPRPVLSESPYITIS